MFQPPKKRVSYTDLPFGDKSITHRALITASLSDCGCTIFNATVNADTLATVDCLTTLGAKIGISGTTVKVIPIIQANTDVILDCKNSGTTARLLAGVVSGLGVKATFIGDKSLSHRPMKSLITPLKKMGADIQSGRDCLFTILPSFLKGIDYNVPSPSAQIKSAILYAGLFAEGKTTVRESFLTRNHTENMLKNFGANIQIGEGYISIERSRLTATDVLIPNDFSTAAYLLAAGINSGVTVKGVGLSPSRIQFLEVLKQSGATLRVKYQKDVCGEAIGEISLSAGKLNPMTVTEEQSRLMLDEIPIACLLAATAVGKSVFKGVGGLKIKESNRITTTAKALTALGANVQVVDDDIEVYGNGVLNGGNLPYTDDHRIAMLGVVGGILSQNGAEVSNTNCISVSCPNFLQLLGHPFKAGLIGTDVNNSLSPMIYSLLSKKTKIPFEYSLFNTEPKDFDTQFDYAKQNLNGINLTMPYKILPQFNTTTNTLAFVGNDTAPLMYNTDGYGLYSALYYNQIYNIQNMHLLLIGCGGAAIAAAETLCRVGAKVTIRNRTKSKVTKLKKQLPLVADTADTVYDGILSFVPIYEDLFMVTENEIKSAGFVFDAYYLKPTQLTKTAERLGTKVVDGRDMLFWQGVRNFELWTGKDISTIQQRNAFKEFKRTVADIKAETETETQIETQPETENQNEPKIETEIQNEDEKKAKNTIN